MLNIIKAYLSLEMSAQDFASAVQTNDELVQFINGRIPQTHDKSAESWKQCPLNVNAFEHDNFDLRRTLTVGYYAINRISRCSTAYNMMWSLFHDDLPDRVPFIVNCISLRSIQFLTTLIALMLVV